MQLVVFVQPFLPGQFVPGFGVCQMIVTALTGHDSGSLSPADPSRYTDLLAASVAPAGSHSSHQQAYPEQHSNDYHHNNQHDHQHDKQHNNDHNNQHDYSHNSSQDHAAPWQALASADLTANSASGGSPLGSHGADQHASHLSCGFCTLYGHAIPPPPALQWEFDIRSVVYALRPLFFYYSSIQFNTYYLTPQSHAPPINS